MARSAAHIWRASIQNVEGLPACPPEICEPLYVSLVYMPFCSECGKKEERQMDTYLYVRVCHSCRNRVLVNWKQIKSPEVQSLVLSSQESNNINESYRQLKWSLKTEVNTTTARLSQLQQSNDKDALQAWVETRKSDLLKRLEYGKALSEFVTATRQKEIAESKRKWREGTEQKLAELGWTKKEEDFPNFMQYKWRSFFDRTTEFTASNWDAIKPTIIEFLETDARERPERERRQRRTDRERKLRSLLTSIKRSLDLLPQRYGPEDSDDEEDAGGPSLVELSIEETTTMISNMVPLPEYADAIEWPIFKNLLETNVSAEEMTNNFETLRDEIKQQAFDWGARFKSHCVKVVREGRQKAGLATDPPRPQLPPGELCNDPFQKISLDDCLLFRADTLFIFKAEACTYDTLLICMRNSWRARHVRDPLTPLKPEIYTWSSKMLAIAETLLASMGCPNASSAEFNAKAGVLFSCGRCRVNPKTWSAIVLHYVYENITWLKAQKQLTTVADLNLTFNYDHDLDTPSPKPFLLQTSAEDRAVFEASLQNGDDEEPDKVRVKCRLCEQLDLDPSVLDEPGILSHMADVHDISDPLSGASIGDEEAMKDNAYIRHCGEFEGLVWTLY